MARAQGVRRSRNSPDCAEIDSPSGRGQKRKTAIYISFGANGILLVCKLLAAVLTNSLSVLASLVDGWDYPFLFSMSVSKAIC